MYLDRIPTLKIGDLEINPPIIQGGMGVRVSRSNLACAAADAGCAGIIACAGLGQFENFPGCEFEKVNEEALRYEIRKAKSLSGGIIGVNIMVAVQDFHAQLRVAIEEKADIVFLGAGLPINKIPVGDLRSSGVKVVPIVSSARAARVIFKSWYRKYIYREKRS